MYLKPSFAAACLLAAAGAAFAQLTAPLDPDWKEVEVPPPPALRTTGLIELDTPRSAIRFGVDPATITIGSDRIVRYVVVAQGSGGALTGIYEGLHCKTGEAKVYARHNAGTGWVPVADPQWKLLRDPPHSAYSFALARQGACMGHSPNRNVAQIVRDLRAPHDAKFTTETR